MPRVENILMALLLCAASQLRAQEFATPGAQAAAFKAGLFAGVTGMEYAMIRWSNHRDPK